MLLKSLSASRWKTKILTNHVALRSGWCVITTEDERFRLAVSRRSRSERRRGIFGVGCFGIPDRTRTRQRWRPDSLVKSSLYESSSDAGALPSLRRTAVSPPPNYQRLLIG